MRKWIAIAIFMASWCPQVRAQNVSVSDVTAYRELFLMVSRQTQASKSHLRFVNLPGTDQSKFEGNVKEFRGKFDSLVESYNAKAEVGEAIEDDFWHPADSLTYGAITKLIIDLSPLGAKRLNAFIQDYKRNIKTVAVSAKHDHGSMLKPAAFHPGEPPQGCTPTNNYTFTWTSSVDNTNFYLTSRTSGTGSMPSYCPHGNYTHTAIATNSINGQSGQSQYSNCPACYLWTEFDNSQPLSALPWDDFQARAEGRVVCNFAGLFWDLISLLHFQVEAANTTSQIVPGTQGYNGTYYFWDATASCPPTSPPSKPDTPPDFPGPDTLWSFDPITTGYVRVSDVCVRWAFWGNSFVGQPWFCFNVPRNTNLVYPRMEQTAGQGQLCTLKDNGYEPPF